MATQQPKQLHSSSASLPMEVWGAFFPTSASHPSSHPNFPTHAHLSPHPQRLPALSGDLQWCSSAPSRSRAGGAFPGPPSPGKGRRQWMEHPWSSRGGAQLSSPAPGAPSTSPSQRGHTEHLGSTHGSSAASAKGTPREQGDRPHLLGRSWVRVKSSCHGGTSVPKGPFQPCFLELVTREG